MLRQAVEHLMGAFRASPENPSTNLANPAKWLLDLAGGGASAAGIAVSEDKAIGVPIAYACACRIAETLGSLPVHVFKRRGKFRVPAEDKLALDVQRAIAEQPNLLQTSFVWRELIAMHALFWGNHYSAIDLDGRGGIELVPLLPWNVTVRVTSSGKRKVYLVRLADGTEKEFREDRILHIPAIGTDGLTGIAPVRRLRNMYGLAIAAENFGSRFFANDARPSVIMEIPGKLKPDAQQNLVHSLYEKFSGAENHWKVLVLEEGAKMHTVSMPLEDAQFLQTRQTQDVQICAVFGVPPHMVGLTEKTTSWGTGIEQMAIGFAKFTMLPWCIKIEQELNRKFFSGTELFVKFSLDGLARGDYKSRMEGYQIAVQNGIKTRNEVRELEDDAPLADGDVALVPANLTTMKKMQAEPAAAADAGGEADAVAQAGAKTQ